MNISWRIRYLDTHSRRCTSFVEADGLIGALARVSALGGASLEHVYEVQAVDPKTGANLNTFPIPEEKTCPQIN